MYSLLGIVATSNVLFAAAFNQLQLGKVQKPTGVASAWESIKTGYFDQLLDHSNPSLGTFKQRYFFDDTLWTGDGAPIVLTSPGEQEADGFQNWLSDPYSLPWPLMKSLGAAGIILERE